jgi:hypothetical protein
LSTDLFHPAGGFDVFPCGTGFLAVLDCIGSASDSQLGQFHVRESGLERGISDDVQSPDLIGHFERKKSLAQGKTDVKIQGVPLWKGIQDIPQKLGLK